MESISGLLRCVFIITLLDFIGGVLQCVVHILGSRSVILQCVAEIIKQLLESCDSTTTNQTKCNKLWTTCRFMTQQMHVELPLNKPCHCGVMIQHVMRSAVSHNRHVGYDSIQHVELRLDTACGVTTQQIMWSRGSTSHVELWFNTSCGLMIYKSKHINM